MTISTQRMNELIRQAKDAALIRDFSPCGAGLPPRFGFSKDMYNTTLETLVQLEQAGPTYNVKWQRLDDSEVLECHGLTADMLAFRIRAAIRNYGRVTLLELTPTKEKHETATNPTGTCNHPNHRCADQTETQALTNT